MAWNATFTVRDKELFICEFRIVESNNPAHEPGSTGSWTCKDPTAENGGAGDVKAFAMALMGIDPSSVKDTDELAQEQAAHFAFALMGYQEAFDELNRQVDERNKKLPPGEPKAEHFRDGFQIGRRIALETTMTKTKAGGDFTVHNWSPAPEDKAA
jgi:hypothetical protein